MSSEPAVAIRNVCKDYDLGLSGRTDSLLKVFERRVRHPIRGRATRERFRALDDISFDVAHGEAVGVIGKNGAGKSTLLKILSRITPPTSGYIDVEGTVGSLLEVGTGFHPELTGIENVYLNGTILGMSKAAIDRRLDEIVDFADVHKFLETPVKRYSSGMRVRLAFAVAAHLEPEILIVDEVLSVGDAGFQAKCLAKMKSVAVDDGRTVLYVSHNLTTLEHLCPRSVLLVGGKVAFDGPTRETVSNYLNTFPQGERDASIGVFDLTSADRTTHGYQKVFDRLEIRPNAGSPLDSVRMGERLQFQISVDGLDAMPDAMVVVIISATSRPPKRHVMRMSSVMVPLRTACPRRREETIVLDIPSVPLVPGDYEVDLHLMMGKERIDDVRGAGSFTVVSTDFLGHGYLFDQHDGQVVVPWEWEVRPSAEGDGGTVARPQQPQFDQVSSADGS
jgi:lipopolysaccharide transport system ATP-binding protein